jgi:hypothetical protein
MEVVNYMKMVQTKLFIYEEISHACERYRILSSPSIIHENYISFFATA